MTGIDDNLSSFGDIIYFKYTFRSRIAQNIDCLNLNCIDTGI